MNISEAFIKRPVMTLLVMAAVLVAGLFSYSTLPVNELPQVDFPTIVVTGQLPGADAETMAASIASPLEAQFSLIPGLDSMSSVSVLGTSQVTLQFRLDRNIDAAAQDVQAAVSAAARALPNNMPAPPTMRKVNPGEASILQITAYSTNLSLPVVDEYVETTLIRGLSTIDGVANVDVFGQAHPAVRIQVDPNKLAVRGIGIDEIAAAIRNANVNLATGTLNGPQTAAVIQTEGQLKRAADYLPLILAYRDGAPVRLADVGTAIESVENPWQSGSYNGKTGITIGVNRQPGSNTVAVVDAVKARMPALRAQLPPSITAEITLDRSDSIRAAIRDVQMTLIAAGLLVVAVIFLFLRTALATVIPSLALPIAVVGTFGGMAVFGYSLDNLSLMALTLCVGFVVDDAIVMLENIMRHIEAGERPYSAAVTGSREVAFTILSMTASLMAVFIPVLFMGGIVGRLLHEFAVTIVIAIFVSGAVSVTLTPMLCSRLLKPVAHDQAVRHNLLYRVSEAGLNAIQRFYARSLGWSMAHRKTIVSVFGLSLVVTVLLFRALPEDFLPSEDTGQLLAFTEGANGISFDVMQRHQDQAAKILWNDPYLAGTMSSVGAGGARGGANQGQLRIALKPRSERPPIDQVITELRRKLSNIPGLNVYVQNRPVITIGGMISKAQYQYTLQDSNTAELFAASEKLKNALARTPGFLDVASDLDLSTPSVHVSVDRDRAAALGITMNQIETALGASFGGQQISIINSATDQFKVILELLPKYQQDAAALSALYVATPRSASISTGNIGSLIPISAVTQVTTGASPLAINHFGQLPAVTISFSLPPGVALSDAVTKLEEVARETGMPHRC